MSKKVGVIAILILSLIILGFTTKHRLRNLSNTGEEIISINNIDVNKEEFDMFLGDEKALVADYFSKQYGAEYNMNFWDTQYGKEKPIELAKERALEKLIKVKIEQELAVAYGGLKSNDFDDIKKELEKEEIMYGAESLDLFQSYMIYHSKVLLNAKERFKIESKGIKEEELLEYYEANKMTIFKYPDEMKVVQIIVSNLVETNKEEVLSDIRKDIERGISIDDLKNKYSSSYELSIQMISYGSDESKEEHSSEVEKMLKEEAYMLDVNQVSNAVEYGNEHYIIICIQREAGYIKPFEEVKVSIENIGKEELFEKEVRDKINSAKVIINKLRYKEIQL